LSSDVELGVEIGDGLRSQDASLSTQTYALVSQAKSIRIRTECPFACTHRDDGDGR
jgi:hypothetical protein